MTVLRETRRSAASSRVDGRRAAGPRRPSRIDRAGFLDRIGRPNHSTNMAPVDTRIRVIGDVGIVDSGFQYTKPDGQAGAGHYTDVYGFVEGRWQCISAHFALRPAPPQTGAAKTADVVPGAASSPDHATLADLHHHYIRPARHCAVRCVDSVPSPESIGLHLG